MRTPTFPAFAPVSTAIGAVIRFAGLVLGAGERRRVVRGLAALDDHMLRDIGLTRFDVAAALVQPATSDATLALAERARETQRHELDQARQVRAEAAPTDGREIVRALPKRAA